jgi:hypothetical protein
MSYNVVQPKWFLHEITSSRSRIHSALTDSTPQPLTPLMPHLRNETFYFDTVEEADEFRVAVAAIKLKYYPPVPPTRHVTQEDLQGFSRFLSNEIAKIKCDATLKECVVCVERLPDASWLMCAPPKLDDR